MECDNIVSAQWIETKKNGYGQQCYELYFNEFYADMMLAGIVQDHKDDSIYIYVSPELNVEYETLEAISIEHAQQQIESMLIEHWENKIETLETTIKNFRQRDKW